MKRFLFSFIVLLACFRLHGQASRIDSLETALSSAAEDTLQVKLLGKLSGEYRPVNSRKARSYAGMQLKLAEELGYKAGMANAYNNLGLVNRMQGNYDYAIDCFKNSNRIFEELNDQKSIAMNLNNLGTVYFNMGYYTTATDYFLKALKIKEKLGDRKSLASSYLNMGALFYQKGDLDQATLQFQKSFGIYKDLNDHAGMANSLINLGDVQIGKSRYDSAGIYLSTALSEVTASGNRELEARTRLYMGISSLRQKQYPAALQSLHDALSIAEELQDRETAAQAMKNLGIAFRESARPDSAVYYLEWAVSHAGEIGANDLLQECYIELSDTYSGRQDYKNALVYHQKYAFIRDSLFKNNIRYQVLAESKFALEKKDNQIALLAKDKALQAAVIDRQNTARNYLLAGFALFVLLAVVLFLNYNQKRRIRFERQVSQVEMTALRAQMNPHFIFNSLNSINKYIQLKDSEQASEYLIKFSRLMRLILENSRFQEVPLEKDLKALDLYIQLEASRLNNNVSYEIIIDPQLDPEITLVPPLILQPIVENAIWHGLQHKKEQGRIRIEIRKEGEMINCIVEDNGIGRFKAQEMKTRTPTHKGESLGMKITDARISILNKLKKSSASIHLADLAEGVRVEVKLPLELSF